jgi:hypothetical protein
MKNRSQFKEGKILNGSQDNYLIYPIIDLVRSELKKMLISGELTSDLIDSYTDGSPSGLIGDQVYINQIKYYGALLSILESNDFTLELIRNYSSDPDIVTDVIINYGGYYKLLVSLLFDAELLLIKVTLTLTTLTETSKLLNNPLGIPPEPFITYLKLLKAQDWYTYQINVTNNNSLRPTLTSILDGINNLKALYNIQYTLPITELTPFLDNPLGAPKKEYIDFVRSKWILSRTSDPTITQLERDTAQDLIDTTWAGYMNNNWDKQILSLDYLSKFLPNPLFMEEDMFQSYVDNKIEYTTLDLSNATDAIRATELLAENTTYRNFVHVNDGVFPLTNRPMSLDQHKTFLKGTSNVEVEEKIILQVVLTFEYDGDILLRVVSETVKGF